MLELNFFVVVLNLCVGVYASILGGKEGIGSPEPELQVLASHPIWVLANTGAGN